MTPERRLQEAHGMRRIRTTMEPDRVHEVTEQEYTDLSRQGLIHDEPEATEPTGTGDPDHLEPVGDGSDLDGAKRTRATSKREQTR